MPWRIDHVDDLRTATHVCEHCHNERVRYVHVLVDDGNPPMRVGCVCAQRLTGDADGPPELERVARGRAARFDAWCNPDHWAIEPDRHTREGRHFHWNYMVLIYDTSAGWRWLMTYSQGKFISPESFPSAEDAKYHFWSTQLEP